MADTTVERMMVNVVTDDIAATRDFYVALLDLEAIYDSDWFAVLASKQKPTLELGIIARGSEVTPALARGAAGGAYLTFVVGDVNAVFDRAGALGVDVIELPTDQFYGQRRMLVRDPAGTVVDVSSPTPRPAG